MRRVVAVALTLAGLAVVPAATADTIRWEPITKDDGIQVWQRKIPGQSLVEFRGKGEVQENFKRILAVLADSSRKTEWMESCVGARLIRMVKPGHNILYNRTGSSFPLIADRDVVLESNVDIWSDKRRITIDVWSVTDAAQPPIDGVVRMPDLRASWVLEALGPKRTVVTYTVRADPGGSIPHWLMNLVAKKMPLKTIQGLRKQVTKAGYDKELAFVEASFDWRGFETDAAPPATVGALEPEKAARSVRVPK